MEVKFCHRFLIVSALCLGFKTNLKAEEVNEPYDLANFISREYIDKSDACVEENISFSSSLKSFNNWPRQKKVVALNIAAIGTILAVGSVSWDYCSSSFHFHNEDWFDSDTKFGGADKLGHAYSTYALTSFYNSVYKKFGYSDDEAILGGALSGWSQMTLIEVCDGFSAEQGFSWEDEVMNTMVGRHGLSASPIPSA